LLPHDVATKQEFQQKLIDDGFEPLTNSGPERAAKFIRDELVRWTPVLKASGLRAG
jgi:tripartite-type tricarboxylate transporter receptor subunit TctC